VSKRLFIRTYGCQMNVYDSDRMAESLAAHGWSRVDAPEDADLVVLNTCHIREKAAEKVYSELGRLKRLRAERAARGETMLLAVAGCVAQAEGEAMLERAPFVDLVVGPQAYHRLPELLARRAREQGAALATDFPVESKFDHLPERSGTSPVSAYLTVQEGCDKFCTFCVVPYTRGAETSRPVAAILAEARRLLASGAKELVLLGQNVNAYHGEGPDGRSWSLARLLGALAELDGVVRLRYTTSHPKDMSEDLIEAHGRIPQLVPHLHLPVQSGSDAVLEAMNRGYTAEAYRRIVERLRAVRPDLALSSDFIVGFPGERETDFEATLDLVRAVGFAQAYSFKYSARPGTPAAVMRGQVKEAVKAERLQRLQALLAEQARAFNEATVGRTVAVLIDGPGRHPGQLVGRTPWQQPVHLDGTGLQPGDLVTVTITGSHAHSLAGRRAAGATGEGRA
jgi:tRNA-2-methylthio-N6-dimethylallyladenosine synthase